MKVKYKNYFGSTCKCFCTLEVLLWLKDVLLQSIVLNYLTASFPSKPKCVQLSKKFKVGLWYFGSTFVIWKCFCSLEVLLYFGSILVLWKYIGTLEVHWYFSTLEVLWYFGSTLEILWYFGSTSVRTIVC